jgi:outer membrane protein OmpA-like peptidoglycan-associated protein
MMRKLIFAIGALLAMAVPALAEGPATNTLVPGTLAMPAPAVDLSVSPTQLAQMPMAPMAYRWNGCYVGLNGGGIWSDAHFTWAGITEAPAGGIATGFSQVVQPAANRTLHAEGGFGGGQFGCNFQGDSMWVVGFEADFQGSSQSASRNAATPATATVVATNLRETFRSDWFSTIRARAGVTTGPLLFYATAGLAITDARFSDSIIGLTGGSFSSATRDGARPGLTVGGGVEWSFNPSWSVKAEYLYANFGSVSFPSTPVSLLTAPPTICTTCAITHSHKLDDNIARIGINYHFWSPPPPPPEMPPAPPPPPQRISFIVFFDWDKDVITREGMGVVQKAADAYRAGGMVQIQVTGYTDRSGSAGYNQRLSERRANNVAKALAGLGVPPNQMAVSGRGENDNRVPTADGVREPQNRRVEIGWP